MSPRRDPFPQYGPHPVNLDLWRERAQRGQPNFGMAVGCMDAMRLLFQLLDEKENARV